MGKAGQIGSQLEKQLTPLVELVAFDRRGLELESSESVRIVVRHLKPKIIINPNGYTGVDHAETEPTRARAINTEAVRGVSHSGKTPLK